MLAKPNALQWDGAPGHYEVYYLTLTDPATGIGIWIRYLGARGGQAHLWGSKHANSWAWVHCDEFTTAEGDPVPGAFVDAVSAFAVPDLELLTT